MPIGNETQDGIEDFDLPMDAAPAETQVSDDANAASSTANDDQAAASSAATDEPAKDTLSVVRDVVEKKSEEPAAASSAAGEEAGNVPGGQASKDGDDDFSDVPFNKHPRFQKLLRERNEFKTDATRYHNVQNFLDREGLTGEDAAVGLTLLARSRKEGLENDEMIDTLQKVALVKRDPVAGWNAIKPWVQKVLIAAGEVLPDDLKTRVQQGELTSEAAAELSRHRATVQTFESQRTFEQQRAEARQQQEASQALESAANTWIADRQTRDPNFNAKVPAIKAEIARLHAMGLRPTTPDGVTEQLNSVYRTVNGRIGAEATNAARAAAPAPRPALTPVTGGRVAATPAPAKPASTLDIIKGVVGQRA